MVQQNHGFSITCMLTFCVDQIYVQATDITNSCGQTVHTYDEYGFDDYFFFFNPCSGCHLMDIESRAPASKKSSRSSLPLRYYYQTFSIDRFQNYEQM